jgi:hypothetical protein
MFLLCVRAVRIGLTTSVLSGQRSTTELRAHTRHKEHLHNSPERPILTHVAGQRSLSADR